VDAPTVTVQDLAPLLASRGAVFDGLPLPMMISRAAVPAAARGDWPLRRFVERAGLAVLPLPEGAFARLRGANTPDERDALTK
jgi:molybdopterin-guanine dinucleotide biosynthesis protein A